MRQSKLGDDHICMVCKGKMKHDASRDRRIKGKQYVLRIHVCEDCGWEETIHGSGIHDVPEDPIDKMIEDEKDKAVSKGLRSDAKEIMAKPLSDYNEEEE